MFNAVSELLCAHVTMGTIFPTSCYPPPVTDWPLVLPRGPLSLPLPRAHSYACDSQPLPCSPALSPAHIPTRTAGHQLPLSTIPGRTRASPLTQFFSPPRRPPPFDQHLHHASHLLSLEGRFLLKRRWTLFLFLRYVGLRTQKVIKCIDGWKLGELADVDDGIKMKMLTTSCMERLKSA